MKILVGKLYMSQPLISFDLHVEFFLIHQVLKSINFMNQIKTLQSKHTTLTMF